ncbi:CDP-diacylglycerol--serine O-phosphatidyltransferase [Candidatus Cytomitobacter indipagum]|uniref:CDP-diacylglycerol--serine O-phosphatidyltransferase n=1 Tax=Candidatus Cytomitobacter indipagum TaxID=2601575 RepID=A0A5C0UFM4_9PROT|nr:CDP-diacylglycerol--serine O-phosphatidyltransferase [Candidatus Cytomitobacter indipagum]QEK38062.1 CDP-diacylglycerol--serine O-phosphatidyltransferase [Candidatus Cytomitobacter indipagum]
MEITNMTGNKNNPTSVRSNKNNDFHKNRNRRVKDFFRSRMFLIPSFVTSISICLGMQAIHFSFTQNIEYSVLCIAIAMFIDGIDGRIARYLNSASEFGKTLDSLADFLSFSIAPALTIYFYKLNDWISFGWSCCIFFVLCMAFRLARFSSDESDHESFTGIPAPAAGLLAFFPFACEKVFSISMHPAYFAFTVLIVSLGMISKFQTIALNRVQINHKTMNVVFALIASLTVLAITYIWAAGLLIGFIYLSHTILAIFKHNKNNHKID